MSSERSSSSLECSSIAISSESLKWECGENSPSLRGDSLLAPTLGASELAARAEDAAEGKRIASSATVEYAPSSKDERKGTPLMWTGRAPQGPLTVAAVLQHVGDGEALSFSPS